MNKRIKRWVTRLLIMCGSFLFTLILLEITVRIFSPQQLISLRPDVYLPVDTGLGWQYQPGVDTIVNTGERDVRLITDENGFRVGLTDPGDPAYRILALGDSYLTALQVNYEQTMTGRLEAMLSDAAGEVVTITNTGVDGYTPNHYLMVARQELARTDYDLVIVFVYLSNDIVERRVDHFEPFQAAPQHTFRLPRSLSGREIVNALLYPINDFLEARSHLYVFAKNRGSLLLARLGLTAYYFPEEFLTSSADSLRWGITADILADISTLAESEGVPAMIVLIPPTYRINEAEFDWYMRAFNVDAADVDLDQPVRLLTTELETRGVTSVLDSTAALRAAFEQGVPELYGHIDRHFTPSGHQVMADYLFPYILDYVESAA